MPALLLLLALAACAPAPADPASEEPPVCSDDAVLFGAPNANTGLDATQCRPSCADCGGAAWGPPTYTDADFAAWRALTLAAPLAPLTEDPYASPAPAPPGADAVCAVIRDGATYTLADFPTTAAARAAGAHVTHYGACGLCSPLADLAVYASTPDLTEPVRACGLEHMSGTAEELSACIAGLGFTEACASIWAYNSLHTREKCLAECLAALDEPYHTPDGRLNDCLQCDEDESGPVFLAVAGRTRRNTGLASSMCRPCGEVRPLEHAYPE